MTRLPLRLLGPAALLALAAGTPSAHAQTADTLASADRERIVAQLDRGIRERFAHWAGVPELDYPAALAAYRQKALATADRREFDLATLAFLAGLRNGHSDFNDAWLWTQHGAPLGFGLRHLEGRWVVSWSNMPGLRPGNAVAAIDGEPFEAFFQRQKRYLSASSERWARQILGGRPYLFPRRFTLTLDDGAQVVVERQIPPSQPAAADTVGPVPHRWLVPDSVAYLRIASFGEPRYEQRALELLRHYGGAAALVVDVRGNGGGSTPWRLRKALESDGTRRFRVEKNLLPPPLLERVFARPYVALARVPRFRGRVVLLTSGGCFSACEDLVGSLRADPRVTVVGDTTGGSSGQPYVMELGDGMRARVGARRLRLPDGSAFEGRGIAPDVFAVPAVAQLGTGADPVLDRALALLRGTAASPSPGAALRRRGGAARGPGALRAGTRRAGRG